MTNPMTFRPWRRARHYEAPEMGLTAYCHIRHVAKPNARIQNARDASPYNKETKMKRLLATITLLFTLAVPAYAWHPITIHNNTDPMTIIKVIFKGTIPAIKFPLDVPPNGFAVFGPIPEGGPCMRELFVRLSSDYYGEGVFQSAHPMNVCTETTIVVSGEWPGKVGSGGLSITHH